MRSGKITAALVLALASSTAYAADQVELAPAAAYNWTGFHVGVGAGLGGVSHNAGAEIYDYEPGGLIQIGSIVDLYSIGGLLDFGGDGALGTVEAGFDYQIGERFVIGIQGDYTWSNFEAGAGLGAAVCIDAGCDPDPIIEEYGLDYSLTARSSWSILGRAGYVANPGALTYVLGGFTRTNMEGELTLTTPGGSGPLVEYDYERDGWTFGGGIEAPITGGLTLKMEYRRTEWENSDSLTVGDVGINTWDDAVVQSMRGVLSWRFGGDNAAQQAAVDAIPAVDWTGFNVGVAGGFSTVRHNGGLDAYSDTPLFDIGSVGILGLNGDLDFGGEGYLGRLEAGYDFQLGQRVVLGAFADYTFNNAESQVGLFGDYCLEDWDSSIPGPTGGADDCDNDIVTASGDLTYTLETGDSWSVGGRAGFLVNPQTLFYGLGAYTHQNMKADLTLNTGISDLPVGEILAYDYDRDGWTFGLGMQTMLTERLSTKLEYRNTQWDDSEIILGDADAGVIRTEDSTVQTFTVGLSWKLN